MLGAIAGDVIGSPYEGRGSRIKTIDFPLFTEANRYTDDTVLTAATAHALLDGVPYADAYRQFANRHPFAGYGGNFWSWSQDPRILPYGSWGNGSAMRVSPVGLVALSEEEALREAERSAAVTHNHPEGIRGAQAIALAVFLAKSGASKVAIRDRIREVIGYPLQLSIAEIRPSYTFDVSCQGSVPEAITAFLEAEGTEQAIRIAISLGGDADTQAAMAGGIAEAFWGPLPATLAAQVRERLTPDLREVMDAFHAIYPTRIPSGR
jgi:ADP-ribosylglycohydrolase